MHIPKVVPIAYSSVIGVIKKETSIRFRPLGGKLEPFIFIHFYTFSSFIHYCTNNGNEFAALGFKYCSHVIQEIAVLGLA